MDAPKCKLCGGRHWGGCAITERKVIASEAPTTILMSEPNDPTNFEPKIKFDRVAYQREYMRKRRAKLKEN